MEVRRNAPTKSLQPMCLSHGHAVRCRPRPHVAKERGACRTHLGDRQAASEPPAVALHSAGARRGSASICARIARAVADQVVRRTCACMRPTPFCALGVAFAQPAFTGRDERVCVGRDIDRVAIERLHVAHRRAHHRATGGHALERLRRADETRRWVERKRQKAHIPAGDELRQTLVRLLSEPVDVVALRQVVDIDLHDGPDHHELPVGAGICQRGQQASIEALIDHSEETQPRRRNLPEHALDFIIACARAHSVQSGRHRPRSADNGRWSAGRASLHKDSGRR